MTSLLFGLVMFEQFTWWAALLAVFGVLFVLALPTISSVVHLLILGSESLGIEPPGLDEAFESSNRDRAAGELSVAGSVVRLFRDDHESPGQVVIQSAIEPGGPVRRYRAVLARRDYDEAVRAHRDGLVLEIVGSVETKGRYRWLNSVTSCSVTESR